MTTKRRTSASSSLQEMQRPLTNTRLMMLLAGALALLCASVAILKLRPVHAMFAREQIPVLDESKASRSTASPVHPIYPYSVIPGGVYAAEDLRTALRRDPVARIHYAGFDARKIRFVKLQADSFRYVSYRHGDHIYWTRNQLLLLRGELLISDGEHYARARCGNRLALYPPENPGESAQLVQGSSQHPGSSNPRKPPESARINDVLSSFETVAGDPDLFPSGDPETITKAAPGKLRQGAVASFFIQSWPVVFLPPAIAQVSGGSSGSSSSGSALPTPAPTPVPEGSAAGLVTLGISALWWARRRRSLVRDAAATSGESQPPH